MASYPGTDKESFAGSTGVWHVRDMARPATSLQRCSCGHLTRTVAVMKEYVATENRKQPRARRHGRRPVEMRARVAFVADPWGAHAVELPLR